MVNREELLHRANLARGEEAVRSAVRDVASYLRLHPGDLEMGRALGSLRVAEDAYASLLSTTLFEGLATVLTDMKTRTRNAYVLAGGTEAGWSGVSDNRFSVMITTATLAGLHVHAASDDHQLLAPVEAQSIVEFKVTNGAAGDAFSSHLQDEEAIA